MTDNTVFGSIDFSLGTLLMPWESDPVAYARPVVGKIIAYNEGDEEPIGEIKTDLIRVAEAISNGVPLAFVFDAIALDELWAAFFDGDDLKDDLEIDALWSDVLYIDEINVEEKYQGTSLRTQAIRTAIAMLLPAGIAVAQYALLTDAEWQQLGFKPLAETAFMFKDIC